MRRTNWCTNVPLDTWHGVGTHQSGRVATLYLGQNHLCGLFATEATEEALSKLTRVVRLSVYGNFLEGSLPLALASLPLLRYLDVEEIVGLRPPPGMVQAIASKDDEECGGLECKTVEDCHTLWGLMGLSQVHAAALKKEAQ